MKRTIVIGFFLLVLSSFALNSADALNEEEKVLARLQKLEAAVHELNADNNLLNRINTQLMSRLNQLEIHFKTFKSNSIQENSKESELLKEILAEVPDENVASKVVTSFPRTCEEIYSANPQFSLNENKWIDPDGPGVGDPPILVQCVNGTTLVSHDSESPISASCDDGTYLSPGCYNRTINYQASIRQMAVLVALSTNCRQSFKYDCYAAYFEFPDRDQVLPFQYSWWEDRYGDRQYFWAGDFIPGNLPPQRHTCQCGRDGSCSDTKFLCNCDVIRTIPRIATDQGDITEKSLLPVTKLVLGRIEGSGTHTLGKLTCSGSQGNSIKKPKGCRDLFQMGYATNGFYTVQGSSSDSIETVFCDFKFTPFENGFETRLGSLCTNCDQQTTTISPTTTTRPMPTSTTDNPITLSTTAGTDQTTIWWTETTEPTTRTTTAQTDSGKAVDINIHLTL